MSTAPTLLTTEQAAAMLGVKRATLEIWRFRSQGPRFRKLGYGKRSLVRYTEADVLAWLDDQSYGGLPEARAHAQQLKRERDAQVKQRLQKVPAPKRARR